MGIAFIVGGALGGLWFWFDLPKIAGLSLRLTWAVTDLAIWSLVGWGALSVLAVSGRKQTSITLSESGIKVTFLRRPPLYLRWSDRAMRLTLSRSPGLLNVPYFGLAIKTKEGRIPTLGVFGVPPEFYVALLRVANDSSSRLVIHPLRRIGSAERVSISVANG
ncbi:MAG: hypothetical protein WAK40_00935 [Thermoplasmata archaeon]